MSISKVDIKKIEDDPTSFANNVSIKKLVNTLKTLSTHYYNTGESLVSDELFDILKNILSSRDPTNSFLTEVGAPITKNEVKLPFNMASLDKIKPDTDVLDSWKKRYLGPYVLSDKLDGVSALLYKNKGYKLYTRGNGVKGQDISHIIPYVFDNDVLFDSMEEGTAIRGELIISKKNFNTIKGKYKNARNTVAGLVNSKRSFSKDIANITDFVAYAVINPKLKQRDQMLLMKKYKLNIVYYQVKKDITNDYLSSLLIKRRDDGKYDIDGIVVIDSSKKYSVTVSNPKYGFAFKQVLTDQIAEATVIDVEWSASKHGYLKPRVKIEPVSLVGAVITYATAFNAKFVVDNRLGPGAIIKLVRSGDVIPHIMKVLKPASNNKPKMPKTPYKWTDTKVDIIVKDIHGAQKDAIIIKKLTDFFKRLKVKYLSEGIIKLLVNNGYNTEIKILKANKKDLYDIDGLGETVIDKIYKNIYDAFKIVTLPQLMAASGRFGRGFGVRKCKVITDAYPNILKMKVSNLYDNIISLEGFSEKTTTHFVNNFPNFLKFFKDLEKVVNISHLRDAKKAKPKGKQIFQDIKFVFTGFRDKGMENFIENNGGKVSSSVSKNTDIVVYVGTDSTKYKKAKELNIKLIPKETFKKKYKL